MRAFVFGATLTMAAGITSGAQMAYARDGAAIAAYQQQASFGQQQQAPLGEALMAPSQTPRYVWKEGYERGRWRVGYVPVK